MDQRQEFSKWMQAVEEALSDEKKGIAESMPEAGSQCGCGAWDCPVCFPDQDEAPGGAKPAAGGGTLCPACADAQANVCPQCGKPHGNQDGQMSPMSMPHGESETEVPMQDEEFDGELEELSDPTLQSYLDKAIPQNNRNRSNGIDSAEYRLGDRIKKDDPFGGDDDFNEPDDYDDGHGQYGGRNDDYHSRGSARGFEEEGAPEANPEPVDKTPSNGKPGIKLGHITQKFEPIGGDTAGEESPFTNGQDNLDEEGYDDDDNFPEPTDADYSEIHNSTDPMVNPEHSNEDVESIMYMQSMGLSMSDTHYDERELYTLTPEQLQSVKSEVMGGQSAPMSEDDMAQAAGGEIAPQATGGSAGGAAPQGGGGGTNYAPGTAPTMPESIQRNTMENIDSDIARIMKGFTKYDALKASKAIVAEKKGGKPEWLEDKEKDAEKKDDKKSEKKDDKKSGNPFAKGGSKDTKKDDKKADKKDVKESAPQADAEVLEWMQRFSKLGNMKGYGR